MVNIIEDLYMKSEGMAILVIPEKIGQITIENTHCKKDFHM